MRRLLCAGMTCLLLAGGSEKTRAEPDLTRIGPEAAPPCPDTAVRVTPSMSIAAMASAASPGTTFCIGAGTHRLQTVVPKAGQRFFGETGSVLSGARPVSHFRRQGSFWVVPDVNATTVERGMCEGGGTLCRFPLGVFVDGVPLRRVQREADLRPGSFVFDAARRELLLADDPSTQAVEVSTANFAFTGDAPDVRIVGLTIEKYFNPAQDGAVNALGRGWRIEHSELRLNSGVGVGIASDGVVRYCRIHSNGQLGATGGGRNLLFENNLVSRNNIYRFNGSWEAGGIKVTDSEKVVFRSNLVRDNGGPGLWCDERCFDATYEGNVVEFNAGAGIFFELSFRAQIRDNRLNQNGQANPGWFWGSEIQIAASEDAVIERNALKVRPGGNAIMFIDQNRERLDGGYYRTQRNRAVGNDITFRGEGRAGGTSDAAPGAANFGIIESAGNMFDRNVYRAKPGVRPRFVWGTRESDIDGFRRRGQEPNGSLMIDPAVD